MCEGLGDFLRHTLTLGARDSVTLAEELTLVERYLAIEQVRFGDRLRVERDVDPRRRRLPRAAAAAAAAGRERRQARHRGLPRGRRRSHRGAPRRRAAARSRSRIPCDADAPVAPRRGRRARQRRGAGSPHSARATRDCPRRASRRPLPRHARAAGAAVRDRCAGAERMSEPLRVADRGRRGAGARAAARVPRRARRRRDRRRVRERLRGGQGRSPSSRPTWCSSTSRCRSSTASRCSSCSSPRPAVVFCTAYDEYALARSRCTRSTTCSSRSARERLAAALERARERLTQRRHAPARQPRRSGRGRGRARRRGAPARPARRAHRRARRRAGARDPGRARRLRRGAGRLRRHPRGRQDALEARRRSPSWPRRSIPRASCASTARSWSTSSASRASNCSPRTSASRCCTTAGSFPSAAPATSG